MTILLDMNLSPRWQGFLIAAGIEAIHWSRVGRSNDSDIEILRYAAEHGMAILTADLDFGIHLARRGDTNPSVIQIRGGMWSSKPSETRSCWL